MRNPNSQDVSGKYPKNLLNIFQPCPTNLPNISVKIFHQSFTKHSLDSLLRQTPWQDWTKLSLRTVFFGLRYTRRSTPDMVWHWLIQHFSDFTLNQGTSGSNYLASFTNHPKIFQTSANNPHKSSNWPVNLSVGPWLYKPHPVFTMGFLSIWDF